MPRWKDERARRERPFKVKVPRPSQPPVVVERGLGYVVRLVHNETHVHVTLRNLTTHKTFVLHTTGTEDLAGAVRYAIAVSGALHTDVVPVELDIRLPDES